MHYTVQLSTGSRFHQEYQAQDIISRLKVVFDFIPVDKVLLGWYPDPALYNTLKDFLSKYGTKMILWLPVFSDTSEFFTVDPVSDIWGNPINSRLAESGETFSFSCPSSSRNINNIKEMYHKHFSNCGFDGVFLDRIRTHSFGGGISGILSCGCPSCKGAYADMGLSLEQVKQEYDCLGDHFFDRDTKGIFTSSVARNFFKYKARIIGNSIEDLSNHFHKLGMEVGLDMFAPLLSPFVGQDYSILASHADYIKPMLYRRTLAPAGLGYEYDLIRANAPEAAGYPDIPMDKTLLDNQLQLLANLPCHVFAGIEINYNKELVKTSPEYVEECLASISEKNLFGAALSWNIMQAPMEHIEILKKFSV